jgi:hypothetical protein
LKEYNISKELARKRHRKTDYFILELELEKETWYSLSGVGENAVFPGGNASIFIDLSKILGAKQTASNSQM